MLDSYNRSINYLRISVTDRCNLRCQYCMPAEGITLLPREEILCFSEIIDFVKVAADYGIHKIRLTGGEPLIKKEIVYLVQQLAEIPKIKEVALTTNGILLSEFSKPLAEAGLRRVNVSLDTMDSAKYSEITRGGDLSKVLAGIDAAIEAGLTPVKINCVIQKSAEEDDAVAVKNYCESKGVKIRFIRQMNLEKGNFYPIEGGEGGNCSICNRLRLTSTGLLKPCLFDNISYDICALGAEEAIRQAVKNKPQCGSVNQENEFYNLGG